MDQDYKVYEDARLRKFLEPLIRRCSAYAALAYKIPEDTANLAGLTADIKGDAPDTIYAVLAHQMRVKLAEEGKREFGSKMFFQFQQLLSDARPEINERLLQHPEFEKALAKLLGQMRKVFPDSLANAEEIAFGSGAPITAFDAEEVSSRTSVPVHAFVAEMRELYIDISKAVFVEHASRETDKDKKFLARFAMAIAAAAGIGLLTLKGCKNNEPDVLRPQPALAEAPDDKFAAVEKLRQEKEAAPMRRRR